MGKALNGVVQSHDSFRGGGEEGGSGVLVSIYLYACMR